MYNMPLALSQGFVLHSSFVLVTFWFCPWSDVNKAFSLIDVNKALHTIVEMRTGSVSSSLSAAYRKRLQVWTEMQLNDERAHLYLSLITRMPSQG